jgi:hypothetical protein
MQIDNDDNIDDSDLHIFHGAVKNIKVFGFDNYCLLSKPQKSTSHLQFPHAAVKQHEYLDTLLPEIVF